MDKSFSALWFIQRIVGKYECHTSRLKMRKSVLDFSCRDLILIQEDLVWCESKYCGSAQQA